MAGAKSNARAVSSDGRLRRGERSREAIVAALFELVGEGVLEPTAQQVAERARVGIRSVFRHFDDMDGLFATMDERLRADALPILREASSEGTLRERARALVDRRVRLFERIAPVQALGRRAALALALPEHAALAAGARAARGAAARAARAFERAFRVVDALDVLLSFEAWDRLRTDQRLSRERARGGARARGAGARRTRGALGAEQPLVRRGHQILVADREPLAQEGHLAGLLGLAGAVAVPHGLELDEVAEPFDAVEVDAHVLEQADLARLAHDPVDAEHLREQLLGALGSGSGITT